MSMSYPRIRSTCPDPASLTVALEWDDGSITAKVMRPLIANRKAFRPLANPALFARVQVINDGRAIAWEGDADICADALWYDAHPQDNPFNYGDSF